MCYFITATLPAGADVNAVQAVPGPEGSSWASVANAFVQAQLPAGWTYHAVTGSWCDCDSALVRSPHVRGKLIKLPRAAARWTETKQKRWLQQRGVVADARDAVVRGDVVAWFEYLKRILVAAGRPPIGLLIHLYSGAVTTERIKVARRSPVRLQAASASALQALEPDVLYEFS